MRNGTLKGRTHEVYPVKRLVLLFVFSLSFQPVTTLSETVWTVDVLPGAITANFASSTFYAEGAGGKEEISLVSSIPNIAAGVAFDIPSGYIGLEAGGGLLLNSRIRSYLFQGQAAASFEVERSMMFGPHLGLLFFTDLEWWGDADVKLSDAMGLQLGVHLVMGDKIAYLLSADYIHVAFDVDGTAPGWTTSENDLDLSGLAVQFGFRAQF